MRLFPSIGRKFLFLFYSLAILSCTSNRKENNLVFIKTLGESLNSSNKVISHNNELILAAFNDRLSDYDKQYKAQIWLPKALLVQKYSDTITSFIQYLKTDLERNKRSNNKGKDIVNQIFEKEGNGLKLYNKIMEYREQVLRIDSLMDRRFSRELHLLPEGFDSTKREGSRFSDTYFTNVAPESVLAILSGLENRIKVAENSLLEFCLDQTISFTEGYESLSAIIAQSIYYARVGQDIEITAGVGSFSKKPEPKITIAGKEIPINEEGVAKLKVKAIATGKHIIPVIIEYRDLDGKPEVVKKDVKYTVINDK
jgi:hypothetical protein